jgi:hypothetical protein
MLDFEDTELKTWAVGDIIQYIDCRNHIGLFLILVKDKRNNSLKILDLKENETFYTAYNKDRIRDNFFDRM